MAQGKVGGVSECEKLLFHWSSVVTGVERSSHLDRLYVLYGVDHFLPIFIEFRRDGVVPAECLKPERILIFRREYLPLQQLTIQ